MRYTSMIRKIIAVIVLLITTTSVFAADRYWIATGTANWNSTANWSATSGGAGGASIPGNADVAIFNASGTGSCTIDATVNIAGINVQSGYTGTISQGANAITIGASHAIFSGGTFTGGSANIVCNGNFTLSGTAFTSTSATLTCEYDYTFSSGSYTHNNGTIRFRRTSTLTGSTTFSTIEFYPSVSSPTYTIPSGTTFIASNLLRFYGTNAITINTGTIEARGDISLENTYTGGGGTALIMINGTGTQTMTGPLSTTNTACRLPNVEINKSSGTLTLVNYITVAGNWTYTSGTIDATTNTSTVMFIGTKTISGTHSLYNIGLNGGMTSTVTIASGTTLTALGNLTYYSTSPVTINTGILEVHGDITLNNTSTSGGGNATIKINGTGNQILTGPGTSYNSYSRLPNVEINKPSGTLTLVNFISVAGNWTYTQGTIDAATNNSTVHFINTKTISGTHTLYNVWFSGSNTSAYTIASGTILTITGDLTSDGPFAITYYSGTIEAKGNLTINTIYTGAAGGGSATIIINGTGNQTLAGHSSGSYCRLPNIIIDKPSGTLYLQNTLAIAGNWTYTQGTIDAGASTVIMVLAKTIAGSHTLNNVTFNGSNATVFTISSGSILTVNGILQTNGASTITINTGTIEAKGDLNILNTSTGTGGGSAILKICGTGTQQFTGNGIAGAGRLCKVNVDKPSGILYLNSIITCGVRWTYTQGNVNASTNLSTVAFIGNATVEIVGSPAMTFHHLTISPGTTTLWTDCKAAGDFTINSGATFGGNAYEIQIGGNWINNGTFIPGTGKVTFNGSSLIQSISKSTGTQSFYKLAINNFKANLSSPIEITNNLSLTQGTLTSTAANLVTIKNGATVTGGSDASFIEGPVRKEGSAAFTFPLGSTSGGMNYYHPLSITAPALTTDAFEAEYINTSQPHGSVMDQTLEQINACEYWKLERKTGTSNVSITAGVNTNPCGIFNIAFMRVAAWNGAQWKDIGNSAYSVSGNIGSVTSLTTVPFTQNPVSIAIGYVNSGAAYATLSKKTDGGYYTPLNNQVYFTVDGEYATGSLSYKVYDRSRQVILSSALSSPINTGLKKAGNNRYILNVQSLSAGYYELAVTDEKNEILLLKFKK